MTRYNDWDYYIIYLMQRNISKMCKLEKGVKRFWKSKDRISISKIKHDRWLNYSIHRARNSSTNTQHSCTFIVLCIISRIDNESTNESMSKKTNNERDTMNATRKIDNFVKPEYRSKDLLEKDNVTRALGKIVSYVNLFDDE